MEQLQSVVIFLVLVALAFAPWVWRKAQEYDARRKCMTGPEMVAYLMYTEQCRGNRESLEHYERSKHIRGFWLSEAQRRMADWPGQVDRAATDPERIERRKRIAPAYAVPRHRDSKLEPGRTDAAG